ncbi:MAG: 4Fe-4S binding protein [Saprospiraceae bacterium]|nr:4Fe-4S binding protein [Saprospiraceae bacterium]
MSYDLSMMLHRKVFCFWACPQGKCP